MAKKPMKPMKPMNTNTYVLRFMNGDAIQILARDEWEARELAMIDRYGVCPHAIGKPVYMIQRWTGLGLTLISTTEEAPTPEIDLYSIDNTNHTTSSPNISPE